MLYSNEPPDTLHTHRLITGVTDKNYPKWEPPGIRAQLANIREHKLEMDFRYEGNCRSFHVLNVVSPAFTCAMSFSEFLFDNIEKEDAGHLNI